MTRLRHYLARRAAALRLALARRLWPEGFAPAGKHLHRDPTRRPAAAPSEGSYVTPAETGPCYDAHGVERPPNPETVTTWVSSAPAPAAP